MNVVLTFVVVLATTLLAATPASALDPTKYAFSTSLTGEETPGKAFGKVNQVAFAPDGDIYVVDEAGAKTVDIFSSEYEYQSALPEIAGEPVGVAVDNTTGDVYVSESNAVSGAGAVNVYNSSNTKIEQITKANGKAFGTSLREIAIDQVGGVLYVPDVSDKVVDEFNVSLANAYKSQLTEANKKPFGTPFGVAVDPSDQDVYVADRGEHVVDKFSPSGTYISALAGFTSGSGRAEVPSAVAVDSSGNVFVSINNVFERPEGSGPGEEELEEEAYLAVFNSAGTLLHNYNLCDPAILPGSTCKWGENNKWPNPSGVAVQSTTSDLFVSFTRSAGRNLVGVFAVPPNKFALTVTKSGTGSGTVECDTGGGLGTCAAEYNEGTKVKLSEKPAGGSTFVGWSQACSGAGACEVTIGAATKVTATFTAKFALTVTKSGTGSGTVECDTGGGLGTCAAEYVEGTKVKLSEKPAGGSTFAGWSQACSGVGACEVTISAVTKVTATFTAIPPEEHTTTTTTTPTTTTPISPPPPPPPAPVVPSNKFTASVTAKGTAMTLKLVLPGPGVVSVSGKDLKGARANPSSAGGVTLKLGLTAAGAKALKKKGKLKLQVTIVFKPTGGSAGSLVKSVTLKAKKGR